MEILYINKIDNLKHDEYLNEIGYWKIQNNPEFIKYYESIGKIENLSFFVMESGKPVSFVHLAFSKISNSLSFGNAPCHVPIFSDKLTQYQKKKLSKNVYKKIFEIFKKKKADFVDFFYHPISQNKNKSLIDYQDAMRLLNYFDVNTVSINTNIVDLKNKKNSYGLKQLRKSLRNELRNIKYKNLFLKKLNIIESSIKDINSEFKKFKEMHFLSAGKLTRNEKSWHQMNQLLINGSASLFMLYEKNLSNPLSSLYCFQKNKFAIGASQVNTKDNYYVKNYNLRHYLEFSAINYYKKNKFDFYEIGQTYFFDKNFKKFTKKHKRIGLSKLSFGANLFPIHYFRFKKNCKSVFNLNHQFVIKNEF